MNKKDNDFSGKYSLTLLITLMIIIVIMTIIFSIVFKGNRVNQFDEKIIYLDNGWKVTNSKGENVDFDISKQLSYGIDGKYSFEIILPKEDGIISSPVISVYLDHIDVAVFLEGELIYTYPTDTNTPFLSMGTSYHYIRLNEYSGKTLRIDIRCQLGDSVRYTLKTPIMGPKASVINEHINGAPVSFIFAAFSLIMTIVLLCFYLLYRKKLNLNANLVYFAMFTLLLAIYISLESPFSYLYIQNNQLLTTIIYCVLALLPAPIFCYLTYYVHENMRIYVKIVTNLFYVNFVVQFILHFAKIVDMRTMLPITQFLLVLCIVMIIVLNIISWKKYSISFPTRIKAAIPMMVGATLDLILLWSNTPSLNYCFFFLIGVIFFIILELLSFVQSYLKLYKNSVEIDSLKNMAFIDSLTSLENQNSFEKFNNENLNTSPSANLGCLVIDINKLKNINDSLGHQAGDIAIKISGASIAECLPENCRAFRSGGDEFIIIVNDVTIVNLAALSHKIINKVMKNSANVNIPVSVSIGFAEYIKSIDENITDMIKRADKNMYKEKNK